MIELTLTQEQSSQLKGAELPVRVRDASGRIVGYLRLDQDSRAVLTPEEMDKIARRLADDATTPELLQRVADSIARNGE